MALRGFFRMVRQMGLRRPTAGPFWKTMLSALWNNPRSIRYTASMMALYLHFGPFSKFVSERIRAELAREEQTASAGTAAVTAAA